MKFATRLMLFALFLFARPSHAQTFFQQYSDPLNTSQSPLNIQNWGQCASHDFLYIPVGGPYHVITNLTNGSNGCAFFDHTILNQNMYIGLATNWTGGVTRFISGSSSINLYLRGFAFSSDPLPAYRLTLNRTTASGNTTYKYSVDELGLNGTVVYTFLGPTPITGSLPLSVKFAVFGSTYTTTKLYVYLDNVEVASLPTTNAGSSNYLYPGYTGFEIDDVPGVVHGNATTFTAGYITVP